jgi:hypothetical protein
MGVDMLWNVKKEIHYTYNYDVVLPFAKVEKIFNEIHVWSEENVIPYKMDYKTIKGHMINHLDEEDRHQLEKIIKTYQNLKMRHAKIWGQPADVIFKFEDAQEAVQFKLIFG